MNVSARNEAIRRAQEMLNHRPIYLDTETTGLGPHDSIVEIAIIDHDGSTLVDTLVRPSGKISPKAMAVHKITDTMVREARRWPEVWPEVEAALRGRVLGIYNADFDMRMLKQTHARNWMKWSQPQGLEVFCVMKLYAQFYGQWNSRQGKYRWQSLDLAGKQCGIPLSNTHRAKDDTLLTRALLQYMADAGHR